MAFKCREICLVNHRSVWISRIQDIIVHNSSQFSIWSSSIVRACVSVWKNWVSFVLFISWIDWDRRSVNILDFWIVKIGIILLFSHSSCVEWRQVNLLVSFYLLIKRLTSKYWRILLDQLWNNISSFRTQWRFTYLFIHLYSIRFSKCVWIWIQILILLQNSKFIRFNNFSIMKTLILFTQNMDLLFVL